MDLERLECKNCGAELDYDERQNGVITCRYCKMSFVLPKEKQISEVLTSLKIGETELANCSFERAYTAFAKAAELDGTEPEAYFGMALAEQKVQYLKDTVNDKLQPICHEVSEKKFKDNANFKKAISLATAEQKKVYEKRAAEIDDIREKFRALEKSGLNYDAFICVKVSKDDGKGHTEDRFAAEKIYRTLKDEGFKPFFSEEEIGARTGTDYEAMILYALHKAKCLIIVCFNESYLRTKWVKNEYTRYISMQSLGQKSKDSIAIVFKDSPIEKLPGVRGKLQGVNFKDAFASKTLTDFVSRQVYGEKKIGKKKTPMIVAAALAGALAISVGTYFVIPKDVPNNPNSGFEDPSNPSGPSSSTSAELAFEVVGDGYQLVSVAANGNTAITVPAAHEGLEVTSIGAEAFKDCAGVKSITLPETVTAIGNKAFSGCSSLETLTLPSGATNYGESAFYGLGALRELSFSFAPTTVAIGELFGSDPYTGAEPIHQINGNYYLPASLKKVTVTGDELPESAFTGCATLETVVLSDSIAAIPEEAFSDCSALKQVDLPASATSIGISAFKNCSSLKEIVASDNTVSIGDKAFEGCSALEKAVFPAALTTIGEKPFKGCTSLKNATLTFTQKTLAEYFDVVPDTLTDITVVGGALKTGVFENCAMIENITLSESIAEIPDNAFLGCRMLTGLTLPQNLTAIGNRAFEDCRTISSLSIPESVTSIGTDVLKWCEKLESLKFPFANEVTSFGYLFGETTAPIARTAGEEIEGQPTFTVLLQGEKYYSVPDWLEQVEVYGEALPSGAFVNCGKIKKVVLSENIAEIGAKTFENCSALEEITYGAPRAIGNEAFNGCLALKKIVLPEDVTAIGVGAFNGCVAATEISVPESVTAVGERAFANTIALQKLVWNVKSLNFTGTDNVFSLAGEAGEGFDVTFGNKVEKVPSYFINSNNKLKSVAFAENSVCTEIGTSAFYSVGGLVSMEIPESVTAIKGNAFSYCPAMERVDITNISAWLAIDFEMTTASPLCTGADLYLSGTKLENLVVPTTVTEIKKNAFYGANSLKSVTLHDEVTSVGLNAFTSCENLADIYAPSVESWFGLSLAENLSATENPVFSPFNLYINGSLLTELTLPQSVTELGNAHLQGCLSLQKLTVPETLEGIENYALKGCKNVTTVNWNTDKIVFMEYNALAFTDIGADGGGIALTFGGNVTEIPARFKMPNVTSATLGENVTKIGESAFANCTTLKRVNIPEKVQTIEKYAFQNCDIENLQWNAIACADFAYSAKVFENVNGMTDMTVTFGENVESIPNYAFDGSRLANMTFAGDKCTEIGNYAFWKTRLTEVVLPDSLTRIGNYAFAGCGELTKMTLPFVGTSATATNGDAVFGAIFDSDSFSGATSTQQYYGAGTYDRRYVYIPNSLKEVVVNGGDIGYGAFMNCKFIERITLPKNAATIGERAFASCSAITEIAFPETLTSVGAGAFEYCSALTKVSTPSVEAWCNITFGSATANPTHLTEELYVGNTVLTEVTVPENLENVSPYAFYNNKKLEKFLLPEGGKTIGESAFYHCNALNDVELPTTLTFVGKDAFAISVAGMSVKIKDLDAWCCVEFENVDASPTNNSYGLLLNGKEVTEVNPSASVTRVGAYAFYNCIGIKKITLHSGITEIGKGAFYETTGLTELIYNAASVADFEKENGVFHLAGQNSGGFTLLVGETVKSLPANLFAPYSNISSSTNVKKEAPNVTEVTFADGYGVERIGENAFYYCQNIQKTVIPSLDGWFAIEFENYSSTPVYYSKNLLIGETPLAEVTAENVPSGVTEVKPYAFYSLASLTKVTLPEGIEKIGASAFCNCAIGELSLSEGLTEIGEYAFYGLDATSVDVPDSVEKIGEQAFAFSELTSFVFPENLKELGADVLYYTDITEITWNIRSMPDYAEGKSPLFTYGFNKVTFGKNVERIPAYFLQDGSASEIVFEEGSVCKEIADYAFYCANVGKITLPDSLTYVGHFAFAYGEGIKEITVPESVEFIGVHAFYIYTLKTVNFNAINCQDSEDTYQTSSSSYTTNYPFGSDYTEVNIGANVKRIPAYSFRYGDMTEVKFAEGCAIEEIGHCAFYCCRYLATMNLPDTLALIGERAFYSDSYDTNYLIPYFANLTKDEDGAQYIGKVLIAAPKNVSGTYTVKEGTIGIGARAFYDTSYSSIIVPDGCTAIGAYAFGSTYLSTSISSITLPASIKKIDDYAFKGSSSVYFKGTVNDWISIEFGKGNSNPFYENILYIGENKTPASSITSVEFPVGTTKIGRSALLNFTNLTSVTIPDTVTEIGADAFSNCKSLTSITLPAGLRVVGSNAFGGCTSLTSVAFKGTLNDWLAIEFAEVYANPVYTGSSTARTLTINGANADTIESVTVPSSIKLGRYALSGFKNLKEVTFEDGTTEIPNYALYDCFALETVTIPNTVKRIGWYAFYRCTKLGNITFPTALESIGKYAFYRCLGFTGSIVLPNGVKIIGNYAFSTCENITSITLSESLTEISSYVFEDCTSLTTVRMGDNVHTIWSWAFKNCTALELVVLSKNLETIWGEAFLNCNALQRASYEGGYGWQAYAGNNTYYSLKKADAESVWSLGEFIKKHQARKITRNIYY